MAKSRDDQIKKALGSGYRVVESSRVSRGAERDSVSSVRHSVVSSQSPGLEKLKAAIAEEASRSHSSRPDSSERESSDDRPGRSGSALTGVLVETTPDPTDRRSSPVRHRALILDDEVIGVSDKVGGRGSD